MANGGSANAWRAKVRGSLGRRWAGRGTAVAGAVALHALLAVAAVLAFNPPLPTPEPPPVQVTLLELTPRARDRRGPSPPPPALTSPLRPRPAAAPPPGVIPPAPIAAPVAAPAPGPPGPGAPARDPLFTGLGQTLDCLNDPRAIVDERCRQRRERVIVDKSKPADRLMIDPRKVAEWDAVLAKRRRDRNPGPPVVPCQGPGDNFGLACVPPKRQ